MRAARDPVRLIPLLFLAAIALGTLVLALPIASADGHGAPLLTALFTATSAFTITGHIVVDTPTYWSPFGQGAILVMIQIGGLGIMTAATLLGLMVGRGFGLRSRLATHMERNRLDGADPRAVLRMVLAITLVVELVVAIALGARFAAMGGFGLGEAAWHGAFHAVSAFNNAGFSTFSTSMVGFSSDALVLGPVMIAIVIGSLGFPVMEDVRENGFDTRRWTLHTKMTLAGTAGLLAVGFVAHLATEWANPATLGSMSLADKALNAAFHSVMPRTAGFNSINMAELTDATLLVNYVLMFVGGGSAGTAGGIKVTTFVILFAIVASEVLRRRDASLFGRRVGHHVERQALTITVLALTLVLAGTWHLVAIGVDLKDALFECISAFATVGLSTGITAGLPPSAQLTLVALMFIGRVGTITAATALALGASARPYRYPEENPIVG